MNYSIDWDGPGERDREEEEGDAWEYWHHRAHKAEADLHATLKAVLYHFGPEGAHKVTTSALAERTGVLAQSTRQPGEMDGEALREMNNLAVGYPTLPQDKREG